MKKIILSTIFVLTLVCTGLGVHTQKAEAACSYQGYLSSGGTCAVSFPAQYTNANTYQYGNAYQYARIASLQAYIQQLVALLEQLQALQEELGYSDVSDVSVTTRSARNVTDDQATLRGEVDFNDEDEATVYFEYGRIYSNLSQDTTHVVLDDNDDTDFSHTITNLREDTKYYFRAVAEDEDGDRDRGLILTFTTDGDSSSETEPEADTDAADEVNENSAELNGSVEMNDFHNGVVFFVYGEDEDQVDDISSEYDTYADIDEDGDNLQKVRVDTDLDGDGTYWYDAINLDSDTDIFFAICVEYEDEDGDDTIECGDTEAFTTDN